MRIEREIKLDYSDVLFRPKRSTMGSRSEVDLNRTYTFRNSQKPYSGIPIMAANMDGVGTFAMAEKLSELGLFTTLVKSYTPAEIHHWLNNNQLKNNLVNSIAVSTGITEADQQRIDETLKLSRSIKYVCIDVANGYSEKFIEFVARFRERYPDITIIAGNVVTPDVTEELILSGADIVKVGSGPGSVCTTRIKTGVGYPQLSAVIECADAAHGLGGHIIADGGCTCPGDVAKAFGAGADFVMLGGMFAGTDEGGGEKIRKYFNKGQYFIAGEDRLGVADYQPVIDGVDFVKFYGMSSTAAQEKHGGTKNYRASEGRVVEVPYKGPVSDVVSDVLGGVRSTCTYVGAKSLKELSKRTTFIQVNNGKQYNSVYESKTIGS
jgi:GMP reductase